MLLLSHQRDKMFTQILKSSISYQLTVGAGILILYLGSNSTITACISDNDTLKSNSSMPEIVIVQADQGKTFEARKGDLIVIRIEENPTTGYRWEISVVDQQIVEILDSDYQIAHGGGIGGGGTRIFRFRAKSPGISQVQLRLRQSWEMPEAVLESFSVSIQIQ